MGGRDRFVARLQHALRSDYIDFSNEPSFLTPWLFIAAGRPYRASFWADRLRRLQLPINYVRPIYDMRILTLAPRCDKSFGGEPCLQSTIDFDACKTSLQPLSLCFPYPSTMPLF